MATIMFIIKERIIDMTTALGLRPDSSNVKLQINFYYYIDTDEIPGFFLLLKNHIFIVRSEDTIFIFHV